MYTAILEQVKKATENGSQEVDEKVLAGKLAEVAAMLRDMRFRSTSIQRKLAENELAEANKRKRERFIGIIHYFPIVFPSCYQLK